MKVNPVKKYRYREYVSNVLPCITYGVVCGSLTGGLVFLFKWAAGHVEKASRFLYAAAKASPLAVAGVFAGLLALAAIAMALQKWAPESKGGGIPRSEGILRGTLHFRWLPTLVGTFLGSMVSFFAGLPLGSEGPAVLMGTSAGCGCGKLSKKRWAWNRYIMTGGAGAGFAVATGAPLSGVLFALEEVHKRFSPMLVLMVSVSVLTATYVNRLLCAAFGMSPSLFAFAPLSELGMDQVGYLLLLGVLVALAVGGFDLCLSLYGKLMGHLNRLPGWVKLAGAFLLTGVLGFVCVDALYSGHGVIELVAEEPQMWSFLAAVLFLRLGMMLILTDCGATGGTFVPTLALGALVSGLIGKVFLAIGLPPENYSAIVLLGMCAFLGGTLRAPLTACVLFLELTAQFEDFFCVALVVFTVNVITELLNQIPTFDRSLEKLVAAERNGRIPTTACFEMQVSSGAFVVGKPIRDILWPATAVVTGVIRANTDYPRMAKDGERKLYVGDRVVVRVSFYDEAEVLRLLEALVGSEHEIRRMEA